MKVGEFSIQGLKGQPWALSIEYWLLSYGSQCINILAYEKFLTLELSTRFLFTCLLAYFSFHPIYSVHVFSFSQLCPGPPHISALQTPRSSLSLKKKSGQKQQTKIPQETHTQTHQNSTNTKSETVIFEQKAIKEKNFQTEQCLCVCVCVSIVSNCSLALYTSLNSERSFFCEILYITENDLRYIWEILIHCRTINLYSIFLLEQMPNPNKHCAQKQYYVEPTVLYIKKTVVDMKNIQEKSER